MLILHEACKAVSNPPKRLLVISGALIASGKVVTVGKSPMVVIPRNDYGERCQFDAWCKLVLDHEAIDYLREMQRRRDRELSFSDLSQAEMDKLYTVDRYPSDRFTFSSHGYDLHIDNELVANAIRTLAMAKVHEVDTILQESVMQQQPLMNTQLQKLMFFQSFCT